MTHIIDECLYAVKGTFVFCILENRTKYYSNIDEYSKFKLQFNHSLMRHFYLPLKVSRESLSGIICELTELPLICDQAKRQFLYVCILIG